MQSSTPSSPEEFLFHGSPNPGLTELDPGRCVVDPADWAGVDASGHKVMESVVWLTSDPTAAAVFALKHLADDLALDARNGVLYLVRQTPLPSDAEGWVYTVRRTDRMRQVRGIEWYSPVPTNVIATRRVRPEDLHPLEVRVVSTLPRPG
jgi:hypothetical protein